MNNKYVNVNKIEELKLKQHYKWNSKIVNGTTKIQLERLEPRS